MRIIQQWSDIFHDSKLILDISGVATFRIFRFYSSERNILGKMRKDLLLKYEKETKVSYLLFTFSMHYLH